jgi:hypothetical protein
LSSITITGRATARCTFKSWEKFEIKASNKFKARKRFPYKKDTEGKVL